MHRESRTNHHSHPLRAGAIVSATVVLAAAITWAPRYCDASASNSKSSESRPAEMSITKARRILLSGSAPRKLRVLAAEICWSDIEKASNLLIEAAAIDPSLADDLGRWHDHLAKRFRKATTK